MGGEALWVHPHVKVVWITSRSGEKASTGKQLTLGLRVEDVDAEYERLKALDIESVDMSFGIPDSAFQLPGSEHH